MANFSEMLKNLRKERGLTQEALAKALSVGEFKISPSAVGMWEQGRREPDFDTLDLIADFFNVSMDEFFVNDRKNINYIPLEIKHSSKQGLKLLELFESMNEEGQDILYGKARELIREQRLEEKSGNREIQKAN